MNDSSHVTPIKTPKSIIKNPLQQPQHQLFLSPRKIYPQIHNCNRKFENWTHKIEFQTHKNSEEILSRKRNLQTFQSGHYGRIIDKLNKSCAI